VSIITNTPTTQGGSEKCQKKILCKKKRSFMKKNKQSGFDDFVEPLQRMVEKWETSKKAVIKNQP